jgi:glyoxylase-like metal-dependent hydrolase (beta-lactamase superfamily II)
VIERIPGVRGAQAYLYRGAQGSAIIDPGYTGSFRAVLRFPAEKDIDRQAIDWVILTHYHIDHAGTALAVCQGTGAKLAVHHDDPPGPQLEPEPNQPEIQEPPAPVEVPQPGIKR